MLVNCNVTATQPEDHHRVVTQAITGIGLTACCFDVIGSMLACYCTIMHCTVLSCAVMYCAVPYCVLCAAGLQYFRDATSWLSDSHVRFGVGVSVDLIKRINELHDLVGTCIVCTVHWQ